MCRIAQSLNLHRLEVADRSGRQRTDTMSDIEVEVGKRVWAQLVIQGERSFPS